MANQYFFIKQGALSPALPLTFTVNGAPYDMTGKTATFSMKLAGGDSLTIDAGATTLDSPNTLGTGYYPWQAGNTDIAGEYLGTCLISAGGLILPEAGYIHVIVGDAL